MRETNKEFINSNYTIQGENLDEVSILAAANSKFIKTEQSNQIKQEITIKNDLVINNNRLNNKLIEKNSEFAKTEQLHYSFNINTEFINKEQIPKKNPSVLSIALFNRKKKPKIANDLIDENFAWLKAKHDLASVEEFLLTHIKLLDNKGFYKGGFSYDEKTLEIAKNIINFDKNRSANLAYILSKPNYSNKELGSIKIEISSLENFPQFQKIYEANSAKEVMLCVGGPAACDQALIASIIPEIANKIDKIIFATRDYKESNVAHSAKQYHIRHANALNADPHLTGRHIIRSVIKRLFLGMKSLDIVKSNFLKIDVNLTLNPRILGIYLGNEINAIKQNIRSLRKKLTEHDINRISAFLGGEFFTILEEKTATKFSARNQGKQKHPTAIHCTFNKEEAAQAEVENKLLEKINISHKELSTKEIKSFFGENNKIYKAYGYHSDTHMIFDTYGISRDLAVKNGVEWQENVEIKQVLLTQDSDGEPKVAGVVDREGNFTYVSKLHFSGVYKVDYVYDSAAHSASFLRQKISEAENSLAIEKPLRNSMTTATGVSINAIFKKRANIGEISVTNSHWTKIAEDDEHMLVRITGGGNTGSECYNPAYALNVIANTRRIFGDDLIGILSTYGCSRAVNAKNSTEWAEIAKGFVVSYGKGGTGNTKRHFEALKALHKLGFSKELTNFCNDYKSSRGGKLGDALNKIIKLSNDDFSYSSIAKTKRRLGFSNKISLTEIVKIILSLPRIIF
jgi:hypothetical protein